MSMKVLLVVIAAIVLSEGSILLARYIIVTARDAKLFSLITPYLERAKEQWRTNVPEARYLILIESRVAANYAETLMYLDWADLPINVSTAFTELQTGMTRELGLTRKMCSRLVLCQLTKDRRIHPTDRMYIEPTIVIHNTQSSILADSKGI